MLFLAWQGLSQQGEGTGGAASSQEARQALLSTWLGSGGGGGGVGGGGGCFCSDGGAGGGGVTSRYGRYVAMTGNRTDWKKIPFCNEMLFGQFHILSINSHSVVECETEK